MARSGMLDVFGNERRYPPARRALCFDQQQEFRRASGPWRSHTPRQSHDGGGGGDQGSLYGREKLAVQIMKPFTKHTGLVAPLDRANVDTDQIIPKQFLKRIERT